MISLLRVLICLISDGVMDGVFNKAQVTDLQWNPFDDEQLAVGTDSGVINLWRLTRADGPRNEMQPEKQIKISGEKVTILVFFFFLFYKVAPLLNFIIEAYLTI